MYSTKSSNDTGKSISDKKINILVMENDEKDQTTLQNFVNDRNLSYNLIFVNSVSELKQKIKLQSFKIIITDFKINDGTAFDILEYVTEPVIVITRSGTEEIASKALREGAYDYLIKDNKQNYLKILPEIIKNAIKHKNEEQKSMMLSQAVTNMSDNIYIIDMNDKIIFVNDAFCNTYGYSKDEIIGKNSIILWSGEARDKDANQLLIESIEEKVEDNYHKRSDGSEFPVTLSRSIIKDKLGNEINILNVSRDITRQKRTVKTLAQFSYIDGLTGISNRRSFDRILESELKRAARNSQHLALIMIDIDLFKKYNDTYGHQAGDECLKQLTGKIDDTLKRSGETVSRYGGEEFAVLLPNTNIHSAKNVAEILRKNVKNLKIPHSKSKVDKYVTISLGVTSMIPTKTTTSAKIISEADKALYQAKQEGRNRVKVYKK
ncbi:MAG: diguanylate cyclase [Candidatus Cloacimonetes bacterium]|nr:diguanylate cyclase [Candidatus Cloacimonadota bacterium]MBL7108062.1 diguanylate cyclase [Candidatus Cloacimonadota bacterium]